MATVKEQNKIKRLRAQGYPKAEIDRRIAQSTVDQAMDKPARKRSRRKATKGMINQLEASMGGGIKQQQAMSGVRSLVSRQSTRLNEYAQTLLHPTMFLAKIPDASTYPRGIQQIRTVITASTWVNITPGPSEGSTKGKVGSLTATTSDDTVICSFSPYLNASGSPFGGALEVDGVTYTDEPFSVHGYDDWTASLLSYRAVSMCINVTYIGKALDNQGQIAIACVPPWFQSDPTFGNISEYNLSYTGAARDGGYQIWLPAGGPDFWTEKTSAVAGFQKPLIILAAKGLPLPTPNADVGTFYLPVFRIEWTLNIETMSTSQLLTATQRAGTPDLQKYSQGLAIAASAQHAGLTNGKQDSADSIYQQIGSFAKNAAGWAWDNKQWLIPAAMQIGEVAALF